MTTIPEPEMMIPDKLVILTLGGVSIEVPPADGAKETLLPVFDTIKQAVVRGTDTIEVHDKYHNIHLVPVPAIQTVSLVYDAPF